MAEIRRVHAATFGVDGVRKVWRQRARGDRGRPHCTAGRPMRAMGLHGVVRGRRVRTAPEIAAWMTPDPGLLSVDPQRA